MGKIDNLKISQAMSSERQLYEKPGKKGKKWKKWGVWLIKDMVRKGAW